MAIILCATTVTSAGEALELTLSDAVTMALRQNQNLLTAERLAQASESRVNERKTLRTSDLLATTSGNQQTYASQDLLSAVSYTNSQAGLAYGRLLKFNRTLRHNIFADQVVADNARSAMTLLRMQTVVDAKSTYWLLISLGKRQQVEQARVQRFVTIEDIADTRRRAGFGDNLEWRRASVQLGLARDALTSTTDELEIARIQFRRILGLPANTLISLTDGLPYTTDDAERLITASSPSRLEPALSIARRNTDRTYSDRRFAKTPWWPQASVTGGYNTANGKNASISIDSDWRLGVSANYPIRYDFPIYYQNNHYAIFNLSYPLYDGGKETSRQKRGDADVAAAESHLKDLESDLGTQLQASRVNLSRAVSHVKQLEVLQDAAFENVDAARIKYQRNRLGLSQLIDVESDLATSQRDYIESIYELNVNGEQLTRHLLRDPYSNETN